MTRDADMEPAVLVVRVMLHEPRWHGRPEWPPSPARLFQALVAGVGRGGDLEPALIEAFRWLERQPPPQIAAPHARPGQPVSYWVPNNDLDAKDGDPANVPEIRTAKLVQPQLLPEGVPFVYAWRIAADTESGAHATSVCSIAERLYQFGRSVDIAWAVGAVLDASTFAREMKAYPGVVLRPSRGEGSTPLACPCPGSLQRLIERFSAGARFRWTGEGRKSVQVFTQPPMVLFSQVQYGGRAQQVVFELQRPQQPGSLASWSLARTHDLVVAIRDAAARRLEAALPGQREAIVDALVGHPPDRPRAIPPDERVRIIPLPSIGHEHADAAIRRVLLEVPHSGPLAVDDVVWAFSQIELEDVGLMLVEANERSMLDHYAARGPARFRRWRTMTPVVVPESAKRRRLEPSAPAETKGAPERTEEEQRAIEAIRGALRHAGVQSSPARVVVQREPFGRHGARAELFAAHTRFAKERLWHVELELRTPIRGPLLLGDGRFMGLGLMQPAPQDAVALGFAISSGLQTGASPLEVSDSFRRAVIARYQAIVGARGTVPRSVSGHRADGQPTKDEARVHMVHDPARARLLLVAPVEISTRDWEGLRRAMTGFSTLRAGSAGLLEVRPIDLDVSDDPLFARCTRWRTVTPYSVNRHRELGDAHVAIAADVRAACHRVGLPDPVAVKVTSAQSRQGAGLSGSVELSFAIAVSGPILLGRTRFLGGGLFEVF